MVAGKISAFFLLLLLILIGYGMRESSGERIARKLLQNDLCSDAWNGQLMHVLPLVTTGTVYEGRWHINSKPAKGHINVYVVNFQRNSSLLPTELSKLKGNCSYVGQPGTIVCDELFLSSFLRRVGVSEWYAGDAHSGQKIARDQEAFMYWLLGHEIGHIINKDKPAHFGPGQFETFVNSSALTVLQEFRADQFAVSRLQRDLQQRTAVESMLLDVLNAEIRRKVGRDLPAGAGIIYDYNNKKVVKYLHAKTHPEFVLRAARMLSISAEASKDVGLANMVSGFIAHMREGTSQAPVDEIIPQ